MLDLGIRRLGFRTVCFVEREAYAQAVLVARMEDASLDPAALWDDVETFDGCPWRGAVDCVAGGFPCVGFSVAGKGRGMEDERSGLWRHFARIIREVEPAFVLIENVPALVNRGLSVVLSDLAQMGFDAEWGCFRASDVGAPHRRDRIFLLAYADRKRLEGWVRAQSGERQAAVRGRHPVADPEPGANGDPVVHPDGHGREPEWVALWHDPDGRRVPFPPTRDDAAGWRAFLEHYPTLEPAVRRSLDGRPDRLDRLRVLGNGVVPDQAEFAFRVLASRALSDPRVKR